MTSSALSHTNFDFPGQTFFYRGKVRDVYTINDEILVMIVTDRISAFDVILPRAIPFKGQVLNQLASRNLKATKDIVPNWMLGVPDANVTIGRKCEPFKVEMVIRGYLAGHAWRIYRSGKRQICGVTLPGGLKENDRLPEPIITPTTKAEEGHDEDISREEILAQGIVSEYDYRKLEDYTRALFMHGMETAASRGLILVDTKYEFGRSDDTIMLIDEIHTPDSSRFFYAEGYEQLQKASKPQRQLSKEFLRKWLIEKGFQGLKGQNLPEMDDEIVNNVSSRYIELYETITGEKFQPSVSDNIEERVYNNSLKGLSAIADAQRS